MIEGQEIETVSETKLLGVTLTSKLTWEVHIDNLCRKANSRLYYLRHLKRAGLPTAQLLTVYKALIRSVTEYACQAWSTSITKEQCNLLEQIQQHAFKIILPKCSYEDALQLLSETSLQARRENLCERLFRDIMQPTHKLHGLLPKQRDCHYALRKNTRFPLPRVHTNRFKNSHLYWCLFNSQ